MDVVRDLLDKKVVDRNGREMGRVDAVMIDAPEGAQPRVAALEIGASVLAYRVHPVLGRCVRALLQACGAEGRPLSIPFGDVVDVNDRVKVNLAFGHTAAAAIEHRLRRLVGALPRSS